MLVYGLHRDTQTTHADARTGVCSLQTDTVALLPGKMSCSIFDTEMSADTCMVTSLQHSKNFGVGSYKQRNIESNSATKPSTLQTVMPAYSSRVLHVEWWYKLESVVSQYFV